MPWQERSKVSLKQEFVTLATAKNLKFRELCRRFDISPKTGYKWLARFQAQGLAGLEEQSRRPQNSPKRTDEKLEQLILELRQQHPAWGAKKLYYRLKDQGHTSLPAVSTINAILKRHGRLEPAEGSKHTAFSRFEQPAPNQLWQMDFKGDFELEQSRRCYPLTVLDDHSRYALGLQACANQTFETVQQQLIGLFRRYGLPERMTMDNGSPWGDRGGQPYTILTVWLMRLHIKISHSRPFHPQTQGKDERFHRSFKAEVLQYQRFKTLEECQPRFDEWRECYNHQRPHEALGMAVPASRYWVSKWSYPEKLPEIEYSPEMTVRKVQAEGLLSYRNREFRVGKAFKGQPVGIKPTLEDGLFEVYFCASKIAELDFRSDVKEQ